MLLVITFYLNMCTLLWEERSGQFILEYISRLLGKRKQKKSWQKKD